MILLALLPEWLTSEKYLTLATWGLVAATIVLGIATLLLFLDGRTKSKEQRERWAKEDRERRADHDELLSRWKREDERRDAEATPKAEWRLATTDDHYSFLLWCANLGSSSFLVTELVVSPLGGGELQSIALERRIVSVGQIGEIKFRADLLGDVFYDDADISLKLQGPSDLVVTPPQPYRLMLVEGRRMLLKHGYGSLVRCYCPKCGSLLANMKTEGFDSEQVRQELASIQAEFLASCPEHRTASTRLTTTANLAKDSV
jgi:hypothetical protein